MDLKTCRTVRQSGGTSRSNVNFYPIKARHMANTITRARQQTVGELLHVRYILRLSDKFYWVSQLTKISKNELGRCPTASRRSRGVLCNWAISTSCSWPLWQSQCTQGPHQQIQCNSKRLSAWGWLWTYPILLNLVSTMESQSTFAV